MTPDFIEKPYVNYCGDALETIQRLDARIDCVCTSPPYFKQRQYGNSAQELGQEPSPEAFVSSLVNIFLALKPCLNPWASLWINIGNKRGSNGALLSVPSLFVIRMMEQGFHLVDEVVWAKEIVQVDGTAIGHCMIEPADWRLNGNGWEPFYRFVLDPNKAWSDVCAVRIPRDKYNFFSKQDPLEIVSQHPYHPAMECTTSIEGRSLTNVWQVGTARKGKGKHFAAFPTSLVERPIAMTCPQWIVTDADGGKRPRERITIPTEYAEGGGKSKRIFGQYSHVKNAADEASLTAEEKLELGAFRSKAGRMDAARHYIPRYPLTTGWTDPDLPAEPGVVLDMFSGTGSTGEVALKLGRRYIGIDLYEENVQRSNERCAEALK